MLFVKAETDSIIQNNAIELNSPETVNFRRNSSTLRILGTGVILYGFWSVIKIATYVALGIPLYSDAEIAAVDGMTLEILMTVLYCMLAGDVIVRLIVGLCARAEGKNHDKRQKGFYLGFIVWEIIFQIYSVSAVIAQFLSLKDDTYVETYVSLFMELSSLLILIEVYIAALSVRKYKKRMALKLTGK